jgi:hypothetical protein
MKQNNNDHSDGKTLDIKNDLCWWKYITNNMKGRRYQGVIKITITLNNIGDDVRGE